ncbi:MAG: hypothetical protein KDD70_05030, partial [Bdellovibrionales bacterium]|nr:hypothetical protein [Bdellovibrionales bacterium]
SSLAGERLVESPEHYVDPATPYTFKPRSLSAVLDGLKIYQRPAETPGAIPAELFGEVVSSTAFGYARIDALLSKIDRSKIPCSGYGMHRHVSSPAVTIPEVEDRRCAIWEYQTNPNLQKAVRSIIGNLAAKKSSLLTGYQEAVRGFRATGLADHRKKNLFQAIGEKLRHVGRVSPHIGIARKTVLRTLEGIATLPETESEYWNDIRIRANEVLEHPDATLLRDKVYAVWGGVKTREEVGIGTLGIGVNFGAIDRLQVANVLLCALIPGSMGFMTWLTSFQLVNFIRDRSAANFTSRNEQSENRFFFDLVSELETLDSLSRASTDLQKRGWKFPSLIESEKYFFSAKNLRSPTLSWSGSGEVVGNDIEIGGGKALAITGPNSGGKTTLANSLFQAQLLAQLGLPIPVDAATISVADRLRYQGPVFAGLESEGRFGEELQAVKDTFMELTPKSLVVFDEIVGGTSAKEQLQIAEDIIGGCVELGSGTVVITHDLELANVLSEKQLATPLTLLLDTQGEPTFRVIEGVSKSSEAIRVAKKIGFTGEDIRRIVAEKKRADH